jgi:hypothetical protein
LREEHEDIIQIKYIKNTTERFLTKTKKMCSILKLDMIEFVLV